MYVNRMPLRCRTCTHEWANEVKLPNSVPDFIAALRQLRCPECGAGMVAISIEFGMVSRQTTSKHPEQEQNEP
jgi:DNA-directed RNA polymerase subunit RPC12/RpoP